MREDFEIDGAFLERDALRKAGKPVEIAVTGRLCIRETILSDVSAMYEIYKQPGMTDYVKPLQPTLREEQKFMEAYIRHAYPFYDYGLWTVLERKTGDVIGRAGLFPSELADDAVELGYLIGTAWQRRGYAVECGQAILRYAAEVLDLLEIHLFTDSRNLASVRTAAALGFRREEILCQEHAELVHFIWRETV